MATILNPILTEDPFDSTIHRFYSLFTPIQKNRDKESDFLAYVATPLIDYFVLDTLFTVDMCIHFINALASLLKAAYLWTLNQQNCNQLIDKGTDKEWQKSYINLTLSISCFLALVLNSFLSTVALFTRPVASAYELMSDTYPAAPACAR